MPLSTECATALLSFRYPSFNFEWITLAVKQISGNFMKKLIWVIKEQNMQTFILRGIVASIHVQKWTLVKHDLFWCLARDRKSPRQRGNKSFLYIFRQKLIWREVCSTNSLPSTVLYKKSIIKYSKALIWVVTQRFVMMSSLNVNRNLHKVVYTKLEKYSAEINDVGARLA